MGNYDLSIDEASLSLKIEPNNHGFYLTCFNKCKHYFDVLILKGKTIQAESIILKMESIVKDKNDPTFNNIIVSLKDRLNDHKVINERISGIAEISQKILEKERGRLIEIMGFFVAILGFVFININLAISSLKFKEILLLMTGMAIILAFFATLVSILFKNKITAKDFFSDIRFWILIILIVIFIIYVCNV